MTQHILLTDRIPDNIKQLPHDVGEFPVLFFGTREYAWLNRGRCFPYQDGDSDKIPGSTNSSTSQLNAAFQRGLLEASKAFEEFTVEKNSRETLKSAKPNVLPVSNRPPAFCTIKVNRPFGDCPVYSQTDQQQDQQSCDCNPFKPDPCGKNSDCINR
jgi:hypothetical protein